MIFVTGGAGFIGSNFVLDWLGQPGEGVINPDKLTYEMKPRISMSCASCADSSTKPRRNLAGVIPRRLHLSQTGPAMTAVTR